MPRGEAEPLLRERVLGRAAPLLLDLAQPVCTALPQRRQGRGVLDVALAQVARGLAALLVDGRAGYFKPAQSFSAAHWYSEVAAHYHDRELGFGRVPPVVGRRFPWRPLRRVAADEVGLP